MFSLPYNFASDKGYGSTLEKDSWQNDNNVLHIVDGI